MCLNIAMLYCDHYSQIAIYLQRLLLLLLQHFVIIVTFYLFIFSHEGQIKNVFMEPGLDGKFLN